MFGCKHSWQVTGAKFSSGRAEVGRVRTSSEDLIMFLQFGLTVVTEECIFCHKLTFSQVAGKPSLPGYVWKDV